MTSITLYHNPRCSKSRAALALLEAEGVQPTLRLYLQEPPTLPELRKVLKALGTDVRALLRSSESAYRELGLDRPELTDTALLQAIVDHPLLLQRPLAMTRDKAAVGRPPENVLELLK